MNVATTNVQENGVASERKYKSKSQGNKFFLCNDRPSFYYYYSGTPNSVIFWSAPKMTLFRGFDTIGGFPATQQLKSMKQVR